MALTLHEADLCPGCGHPMTETTDNLYEVPLPTRCMACDAIETVTEAGTYKNTTRPGALRFAAVVKPPRKEREP